MTCDAIDEEIEDRLGGTLGLAVGDAPQRAEWPSMFIRVKRGRPTSIQSSVSK
jgi:hypothetical protein